MNGSPQLSDGDGTPLSHVPKAHRAVTAASLPPQLHPGLSQLARALATGEDREIVAAAKKLDLGVIAAALNPAEPIIVPSAKPRRAGKKEPVSIRVRMAGRLARLASNPRVDLTTWEKNFIVSVVPGLRADMPPSKRQAETIERLIKKPRRRLS